MEFDACSSNYQEPKELSEVNGLEGVECADLTADLNELLDIGFTSEVLDVWELSEKSATYFESRYLEFESRILGIKLVVDELERIEALSDLQVLKRMQERYSQAHLSDIREVCEAVNSGVRQCYTELINRSYKTLSGGAIDFSQVGQLKVPSGTSKEIARELSKVFRVASICEEAFGNFRRASLASALRSPLLKSLELSSSLECYSTLYELTEFIQGYRAQIIEEYLRRKIPIFNQDSYLETKIAYGAKAAGLDVLQALTPFIRKQLKKFGMELEIEVSPYLKIPTQVFNVWKAGGELEEFLCEPFKWVAGRQALARSSSVYSEDNEGVTGAGVYETLRIAKGARYQEFKKTVVRVLESFNSSQAVNYRNEKGIESDQLTVVLQLEVPLGDQGALGYINSTRYALEKCIDIAHSNNVRPVVAKFKLLKFAATEAAISRGCQSGRIREPLETCEETQSRRGQLFYYQHDQEKLSNEKAVCLGFVAWMLEAHFGQPVQIEYLLDFGKLNLLQVRTLPKDYGRSAAIKFPDDLNELYSGRALGAVDKEFDILPFSSDNHTREGMIIFQESWCASIVNEDLMSYLPATGVVWVQGPSVAGGGHIETLAMERKLVLIYNPGIASRSGNVIMDFFRASAGVGIKPKKAIEEFRGLKRLRVVATGGECKVYPPASF